jgi:DNA topoisomerase-1
VRATNKTKKRKAEPRARDVRAAFGIRPARKPPRVTLEKLDELKEPEEAAKRTGLRYVNDDSPGLRRMRSGKRFRYVDGSGKAVRDSEHLERIRSLAIPPAWTDVWICPTPNGHIQATGRDARGRKQYRYHPRWREARDATKYTQMIAFARALPKVRRRVARDLKKRELGRERVLATVVKLLEASLIRVGNDEYARENDSYGLTTLRNRHVDVKGSRIKFDFRGKSGKRHAVYVDDRRLAKVVRGCQDLPGQELFGYLDEDGRHQDVGSDDVNAYLREISGADFTAKDFRTWAGTVLAAMALEELGKVESQTQRKKNIVRAVEGVAKRLGNTPAVCRKCYVHPVILEAYLDGATLETLAKRAREEVVNRVGRLRGKEAAVLAFLERRLAAETRAARKAARTNGGVNRRRASANARA